MSVVTGCLATEACDELAELSLERLKRPIFVRGCKCGRIAREGSGRWWERRLQSDAEDSRGEAKWRCLGVDKSVTWILGESQRQDPKAPSSHYCRSKIIMSETRSGRLRAPATGRTGRLGRASALVALVMPVIASQPSAPGHAGSRVRGHYRVLCPVLT